MKLDKKFSETITQALIDRIKEIEKSNWEKPWLDNVAVTPKNLDGQSYNGLNRFLLLMLGGKWEVPVYMTFLRAKREGLRINSGEKSVPVQYGSKIAFHRKTRKSISMEKYLDLNSTEREFYGVGFMMKHYNVFNVDQTNMQEVNPSLYNSLKAQIQLEKRELEGVNNSIDLLVINQGWFTPIHEDQVIGAFYNLDKDSVHVPKKEFFKSDDHYYSTLLHELAHSTGHSSRLNRQFGKSMSSDKYAKEELVAELSASIVGQKYNVSKTILEDNAQYLKSWLTAINKEPEFLNMVLDDVVKASDMIVNKVEEVSLKQRKSETLENEKESLALEPSSILKEVEESLGKNWKETLAMKEASEISQSNGLKI